MNETRDYGNGSSGVEVGIYITEGETLITYVRKLMQGTDGEVTQESHRAGVHDGDLSGVDVAAPEAIKWLKADNNGRLGELSKRAWVEACEKWPQLRGQVAERVK